MRSDTVAHWLAAIGAASLNNTTVHWSGAEAVIGNPVMPDAAALKSICAQRTQSGLLSVQGRRDAAQGAIRARDHLLNLSEEQRTKEWEWFITGEETSIQLASRKAPGGRVWDTYSLGKLYPSAMTGNPVSAWLAVCAVAGASVIQDGRHKWRRLQSRHPDVINTLYCIMPANPATPEEIAAWYTLAATARIYELRVIAGKQPSYCEP